MDCLFLPCVYEHIVMNSYHFYIVEHADYTLQNIPKHRNCKEYNKGKYIKSHNFSQFW